MMKGIKRFAALAVFVLPLAALTALPASAVRATGAFELDGDATSSTAPPPPATADDWDRVCHQVLNADCSTSLNTTGGTTGTPASAVEFASQTASGGTTFTGGGSKDPIDITSWAWNQASGGLPGKDILLNGFAARYDLTAANPSCPSGPCSIVFFGMDRFDNSGDAQNGFWFLQK